MIHVGSFIWYYYFPLLVIIVSLVGKPTKKKGILVFFMLFFFTCFRGDYVGNDTLNYMRDFSYLGGSFQFKEFEDINSLSRNAEVSNILLNKLLFNLGFSDRSIITAYSIITYVFILIAQKLYKFNLLYFCLLYVLTNMFFMTFNLARQLCAVSILLVAYYYFMQDGGKNLINFILLVIFAATMHMSAFFSLLILPLRWVKLDRKVAITITGLVSGFFIISVFNPLGIIMDLFNFDYVTRYQGLYDDYNRSLVGKLFSLFFLFSNLFLFYSVKVKFGKDGLSQKCSTLDILFLVSIIIDSLFDAANGMMSRIAMNFSIIQCVYLAFLLPEIRFRKLDFKAIILFLYILLSLYSVGSFGYNGAFITGYYLMF